MLEIRKLIYLDAVYRHRSFTQASKELFVTQSALSIGIRNLEQELGVTLLTRSSGKITFTPEGEEFILYARRILQECQAAENRMSDLSDSKAQTLHIGFSPTLGTDIQAYLLSSEFSRQHPLASVYFDEGFMNFQIEKIKQETLDLSYNALPSSNDAADDLNLIKITEEEIFAVMLPSHPLAQFNQIGISQLADENISLLDDGSLIRHLVLKQLGNSGIIPHIRSSHNQVFCMINVIKMGNYIGFLNASNEYMTNYLTDSGLILRPLYPSVKFDVGFILKKRRHIPRLSKELIDFVRSGTGKFTNAIPADT